MGFVGAITQLGADLVRPHDIEVSAEAHEGSHQAMVERVVWLGFGCRLEAVLGDGQRVTVQATRAQVDQAELRAGEIVYVRAMRSYRFDDGLDDGGAMPRGSGARFGAGVDGGVDGGFSDLVDGARRPRRGPPHAIHRI
jgi:sulfate transport system ATP-binding protein